MMKINDANKYLNMSVFTRTEYMLEGGSSESLKTSGWILPNMILR